MSLTNARDVFARLKDLGVLIDIESAPIVQAAGQTDYTLSNLFGSAVPGTLSFATKIRFLLMPTAKDAGITTWSTNLLTPMVAGGQSNNTSIVLRASATAVVNTGTSVDVAAGTYLSPDGAAFIRSIVSGTGNMTWSVRLWALNSNWNPLIWTP